MSLDDIRNELRRVTYPDGCIVRVELKNGRAVVVFQDWQERSWRFEFGGVVLFRAYEYGGPVEGVWATDTSEAIKEAVLVIERDGGRPTDYPDLVAADFSGDDVMMTLVFQTLHISG